MPRKGKPELYQTIRFDLKRAKADIDAGRVRQRDLYARRLGFLERLSAEGFFVLVEQKFMYGLVPSVIVGGDRRVKERAYELAAEMKLEDYVGNGPWYAKNVTSAQAAREFEKSRGKRQTLPR